MQARDLSLEYKREFCTDILEFWLAAKKSKSMKHRTSHLDCVWSKSLGFLDHDEKKWVGLSISGITHNDWECPSEENPDKWEIFISAVKTWHGRDLLFGVCTND